MTADQIRALAWLVASLAGLVLVLLAGYIVWKRPGTPFKVRHRDSELEIGGRSTAEESDKETGREPELQAEPAPSDGAEPSDEEESISEQESKGPGAYALLREGEYEEGMRQLRESTEDDLEESKRQTRSAFAQYVAAVDGGVADAAADLRQLAERHNDNAQVLFWYAMLLSERGDREQAMDELRKAKECAHSDSEKGQVSRSLSRMLWEDDRQEEAIAVLRNTISSVTDDEVLAKSYKALGNRYEDQDRFDVASAMYERAIRLSPANENLRFSTAYKYGERDFHWMALTHYQYLLAREREASMAANNAGVECQALDLDLASIDYFRTAADAGNTLSMANIARRFLESGFREEAESELDKAMGYEDCHPNVPRVMSEMAENADREEETMSKGTRNAELISEWLHRSAEARLQEHKAAESMSGKYRSEAGRMNLSVNEDGELHGVYSDGSTSWKVAGELGGQVFKIRLTEKTGKESEGLQGFIKSSPAQKGGLLIHEGKGVLYGFMTNVDNVLDIKHHSDLQSYRFYKVEG